MYYPLACLLMSYRRKRKRGNAGVTPPTKRMGLSDRLAQANRWTIPLLFGQKELPDCEEWLKIGRFTVNLEQSDLKDYTTDLSLPRQERVCLRFPNPKDYTYRDGKPSTPICSCDLSLELRDIPGALSPSIEPSCLRLLETMFWKARNMTLHSPKVLNDALTRGFLEVDVWVSEKEFLWDGELFPSDSGPVKTDIMKWLHPSVFCSGRRDGNTVCVCVFMPCQLVHNHYFFRQ